MNEHQVEKLIRAIRSISHGGINGPEGLEALAMAVAGNGLRGDLCSSLDGIAEALGDIAEALREVNNGN